MLFLLSSQQTFHFNCGRLSFARSSPLAAMAPKTTFKQRCCAFPYLRVIASLAIMFSLFLTFNGPTWHTNLVVFYELNHVVFQIVSLCHLTLTIAVSSSAIYGLYQNKAAYLKGFFVTQFVTFSAMACSHWLER
ncbi:hypothetical protein L596_021391 [Steinernema carpocapsae]|uniref:Uncharacterized protein n=1 Tax=Steinernema carpocapsae TaxID=34508 RepID=A0A4U5MIL5_STECR|nr:hypothetical protein L596_021391 [Steinernema carpocapsae]